MVIKKKIWQILFFVLVIGITLYSVFEGESLTSIWNHMSNANPWWIILCFVMVLGFVYCESWIIRDLFAKLNIKTGRFECFMYSCVGFFFSCITPSASGGQPAQMVYMKKKGIRIATSTSVLMWVTIFYKMVLVLIGLGLMVLRLGFIKEYMGGWIWVFYLGIFLNVVCVALMVMLWIKSGWLESMGKGLIALLHKIHIVKKPDKLRTRLHGFISNYDEAFVALRGQIGVILKAFFITILQRVMLFSITGFVYLAFGLEGTSVVDVIILQSVISIAVDMLPLPGGSGISEHLFVVMFAGIFTGNLLVPAMVLSRGIAFYVQVLFCGAMTIVTHIYFSKKTWKVQIKQSEADVAK